MSTYSVIYPNAIKLHYGFFLDGFRRSWVEYRRRQEGDSICLKLVPRIKQARIIKPRSCLKRGDCYSSRGEWVLDALDTSFLCFLFLPCFASFLTPNGNY